MKVLYVSTYYNASHFIELQTSLLKRYCASDVEFVVADDADDHVKSILTPGLARDNIQGECSRLGVRHVRVPQHIHEVKSAGGLVPDGLPPSHATERHRACLHWIFKNYKKINVNDCDLFVITDSDVLVRRQVDFGQYMEGFDIVGTGRGSHVVRTYSSSQYWPDDVPEIRDATEADLKYLNMYMAMFDLRKVHNLDTIDIGGFAGTDTGGKSHFFIKNYTYDFLNHHRDFENQLHLISKNGASREDWGFVHITAGGSNWDLQSVEYYKEKLRRAFLLYIPEYPPIFEACSHDVSSRAGTHTFKVQDASGDHKDLKERLG